LIARSSAAIAASDRFRSRFSSGRRVFPAKNHPRARSPASLLTLDCRHTVAFDLRDLNGVEFTIPRYSRAARRLLQSSTVLRES
jgi:hypothetical protein